MSDEPRPLDLRDVPIALGLTESELGIAVASALVVGSAGGAFVALMGSFAYGMGSAVLASCAMFAWISRRVARAISGRPHGWLKRGIACWAYRWVLRSAPEVQMDVAPVSTRRTPIALD